MTRPSGAQPSTAPPPKAYPPTPHQSSTPAVPPSVPTESEPSYIQHLRAHVPFLGIKLFVHRVPSRQLSGLPGAYHTRLGAVGTRVGGVFLWDVDWRGKVRRKEAPTVDKRGVQGESEEEEMPDTCPCIGSFILPIPLNGGDKLMVRTTPPHVMFELAFLMSSVSRRAEAVEDGVCRRGT
ncbi:hypothetical protein FRC09_001893 [Ceratobasidium sp. 395]|nr:hypothetical protein FRC09_001893 [Ceratobasidium sp. 395]